MKLGPLYRYDVVKVGFLRHRAVVERECGTCPGGWTSVLDVEKITSFGAGMAAADAIDLDSRSRSLHPPRVQSVEGLCD